MRGTFLHCFIAYHRCTQNSDGRSRYILVYRRSPRKLPKILHSSCASFQIVLPDPKFDVRLRSFVVVLIPLRHRLQQPLIFNCCIYTSDPRAKVWGPFILTTSYLQDNDKAL